MEPDLNLNSAERKRLRGLAMNVKPAVLIGRAGVTPAILEAVETALARDGLIKVRIEAPDKTTRKAWLREIATDRAATVCGEVGHTASLYRPRAESD